MNVHRMDERKKVVNYLGMDVDFTKGEVSISMRHYVK